MLEEVLQILITGLNLNGIPMIGSFLVATAFGIFYTKNTQYGRFLAISQAFWVMSLRYFLMILVPTLAPLNEAFTVPQETLNSLSIAFNTLAAGLFLSSLFPSLSRFSKSLFLPILFSLIIFAINSGFLYLNIISLPGHDISTLTLGVSLIIAGLGFHTIQAVTQKMIFFIPRLGLIAIGLYIILRVLNLIVADPAIPTVLYGIISVSILIAQLRFTYSLLVTSEQALEKEKKKKTLFWDIAPFPILLTRLMDDSVLYMNPAGCQLLDIDKDQLASVHFSNYFVKPEKRAELIEKTKSSGVVEGFEVELVSQVSGQHLWITLSSRVFELNGELVLYINFTNITDQKQTEHALFVQASTDALTGLNNRRQFFALTGMALTVAQRQQKPFSVLMLDIDHFKAINDTYGHDAGDVVLQRLADILKQNLRKSDVIARWGGEEFVIFLLSAPEKAPIPANKIRKAVEDAVVVVGNQQIRFTISLGISLSQTHDIAALQKEADIALYHAKANGRNQVASFSPEMATTAPIMTELQNQ